MKLLVVLVTVVLFLTPAAASAASGGPCAFDGGGPYEYQDHLMEVLSQSDDPYDELGDAERSAREALGAQFGGVWLSTPDQGWAVGVAPGSITLAQAHDAIVAALGTRYAADDLAYLDSTLNVYAQLYGEDELRAIQDALADQMTGLGVGWTIGVGCDDGDDAWRTQVELFNDSTPEIVARVQALIAQYGDRVRLVVRDSGPPEEASARPTSPRAFVRFARAGRCVKAGKVRIRLRRGTRSMVRRVTVTVAGHRHRLGRHGLTVTLHRKVTRVRIMVRLRTGERLRRTYSFRRC